MHSMQRHGCGHHSNPGHGCGHHAGHGHGGMEHHAGGCCCSGHEGRRFPTREERISQMEEYLNNLKAEIKGVEENLAELKKG